MTEIVMPDSPLSLPVGALGALHRALAAGRSPVEAAEAARRLGYDAGPAFFAALQDSVGDSTSLDADEFWDRLSEFLASLGWGHLVYERLHPGVAALSSADWGEADAIRSSDHPACHISTGLLADLLGRVGGTEIAVMEVECRSGGDSRCRFLVGGREALDGVYEELRAGASPADSIRRLG